MNRKIVKIRRIDELPSAPLPGVKRSYGVVKHSSLGNLTNKRRKVPVSGERSVVMEKPVVMSKLPFSSFPEIDRYTDMRQVYPSVYCCLFSFSLSLRSLYSLERITLFFRCISSVTK